MYSRNDHDEYRALHHGLGRDAHPDGVDALLDLVRYTAGSYDAALKTAARVAWPLGAAGDGPSRSTVMAAPTFENLQRLTDLLADATLRIPVQPTYELADAPAALKALTPSTLRASSRSASADGGRRHDAQ
jgi:hypothetical protein